MYLDLFIIQLIIVYIIDISGISNYIKKWVYNYFFKNSKLKMKYYDLELKPFLCSTCMTHHLLLIYLIIFGEFELLNYAFVCLLSYSATISMNLLFLIKELSDKIIDKINRII